MNINHQTELLAFSDRITEQYLVDAGFDHQLAVAISDRLQNVALRIYEEKYLEIFYQNNEIARKIIDLLQYIGGYQAMKELFPGFTGDCRPYVDAYKKSLEKNLWNLRPEVRFQQQNELERLNALLIN